MVARNRRIPLVALLALGPAGCSLAADALLGNDAVAPTGEAVVLRPSQPAEAGDQSAATPPSPRGSAAPSSSPEG